MSEQQPIVIANEGEYTYWRNPTDKTLSFKVWLNADAPKLPPGAPRPKKYQEYVIPPGQIVQIPKEYDQAIQRVEGKHIVAGLCPQLKRVNRQGNPTGPQPPLASAIDTEAQERKAIEEEVKKTAHIREVISALASGPVPNSNQAQAGKPGRG